MTAPKKPRIVHVHLVRQQVSLVGGDFRTLPSES